VNLFYTQGISYREYKKPPPRGEGSELRDQDICLLQIQQNLPPLIMLQHRLIAHREANWLLQNMSGRPP